MDAGSHQAGWRSTIGTLLKRVIATVVAIGWIAFWGMIVRLHLRDGDLLQAGVTAALFVAPAVLLSLWVVSGSIGGDWAVDLPGKSTQD